MKFVPPWLSGAQATPTQPQPQGVQHGVKRSPVLHPRAAKGAVAPPAQRPDIYGFCVPEPWPWDGGLRREPVLDMAHNPPRVVRFVGWRVCMKCRAPFWSKDVVALRLCLACKHYEKTAGDT